MNGITNTGHRNLVIFEIIDKSDTISPPTNKKPDIIGRRTPLQSSTTTSTSLLLCSTNECQTSKITMKPSISSTPAIITTTSTASNETAVITSTSTSTPITTVIPKKPGTGILLLTQASFNELLHTVELNMNNNNNINNNNHLDKDGPLGQGHHGPRTDNEGNVVFQRNSDHTNHHNIIHHTDKSCITNTIINNNQCNNNTINSNNTTTIINSHHATTNTINSHKSNMQILMINSSALPCLSGGAVGSGQSAANHLVNANHMTGDKTLFGINNSGQVNIFLIWRYI